MPGPSNLPPGVTDRMIEEQAGAFQNHDLHDVKTAAEAAAHLAGWENEKYPPGKYEGEPYEAPYWYEVTILDGCGEVHDDSNYIQVNAAEREAFKLSAEIAIVGVSETLDGFVYISYMTQEDYDALVEAENEAIDNAIDDALSDGQPDEAKEWEDFDPDC